MPPHKVLTGIALICSLLASPTRGQGPGSCGVHLDILATGTSTHAAIADVPGAPGAATGVAPGAAGNPYCAWAPAFSTIRLRLTVAQSTLGGAPFGPGSFITIFWGVATPNLPLASPPGAIPTCHGGPWIISVLPFGGALVDGLGVLGPQPIVIPVDPGHPSKFELTLLYPFAAAPPINFQAAILTPGAGLAVSNGASVMVGTNPNETDLFPSMVQGPNCSFAPLDEGGAPVPMPPGFAFYGTPVSSGVARANGVLEFGPNANVECDFNPDPSGLGCGVTTSSTTPRVAVNFFDTDLSIVASSTHLPGLTVESVPAAFPTPSRTIIRWKHACSWLGVSGILAEWATSTCEVWGGDVPFGSNAVAGTVVVVRQEHHVAGTTLVHGFLGIGPGDIGQGFGGPATACVSLTNWTHYGGFFHAGAFMEALHLTNWGGGNAADSVVLSNLATAYVPGIPGSYTLYVY